MIFFIQWMIAASYFMFLNVLFMQNQEFFSLIQVRARRWYVTLSLNKQTSKTCIWEIVIAGNSLHHHLSRH